MRKKFLACFFIAALLLTWQSALYASYGLNVIENDSIGVIYFNLGKAYNVLRDQVKNFDKTADASTKAQVEEVLKSMATDSPLGKDLTVARISETLEKWHNDGVFIPTGGVWISVAGDLQPKAVIEAQIKVDKFAELLKSLPDTHGIDFTPKNNVINLSIPGIALPIEINSERIVVGSVSAVPQQPGADWQPYYKRVSSPEQHLAVELDVQTIIEKVINLGQQRSAATSDKACASNMRVMLAATEMYNMDNEKMLHDVDMKTLVAGQYLKETMVCPDGGTYSARGDLAADGEISCSIHNTVADLKKFDGPAKPQPKIDVASQLPDPRIQHIVRARIFADAAGLLLAIAVKDEPTRQQFKELLQQNLKMAEEQLSQNKGDARVETVKKIFAALSHVDKAPWLGVSIKQTESEQILVGTAVVGVLAAIAIPNFQKARQQARTKACFANQRVLLGATEMYNMDHAVMLSELNVEALVQKHYIKTAPVCPENGVYSASGDMSKDGSVKCSVHGSIVTED